MGARTPEKSGNWVVVMHHPSLDPSVYGPFESEEEAARAARHLQERWGTVTPEWDETGFSARVTVIRTMGQPYDNWEDPMD
jgi:hypothetical protein